jgi:hypothetical protein
VSISALYRSAFGVNFSGIYRYHSGTPYTEWAGADISCGPSGAVLQCKDGYDFDLAPGVTHVNSRTGTSFSQFDLRLSKEFTFHEHYGVEVIGEVFNLFNAKNPANFSGNCAVDTNPASPTFKQCTFSGGFGQAITFAGDPGQGEQRLAQLGLRITF